MGETIKGGYYLGVDGKYHDANGKLVEKQSDKARAQEVEDQKGKLGPGEDTPTGTEGNPGPLGSLIPIRPAEPGESTAEKSLEKEGIRGGKKESAKGGK